MNQHPGTLGRKLGMTQFFDENGRIRRVTVIEAPTVVVGKRTMAKDGYSALILGLGDRKSKHINKAMAGFYAKAQVDAKHYLKEFRLPEQLVAEYEIGQKVELDKVFEVGQFIDVCATSRGKGFSGVVRRYNFATQVSTHGTHEYTRHGGSIGQNMTPGRTFKGKRMPGQYGNKVCSVLNLKVVKIIPEQDLLLIQGGVPGSPNGIVVVRGAVKKMGGRPKTQ